MELVCIKTEQLTISLVYQQNAEDEVFALICVTVNSLRDGKQDASREASCLLVQRELTVTGRRAFGGAHRDFVQKERPHSGPL